MTLNRSIRPKPAEEIAFSLPQIQESKLSSGLKLLYVKKDDLPIVQFNLVVNAGSKLDYKNKKGVVNLLAMMLDEGAGEFSPLQLSDAFDMLGANFNISRNQDSLYVSLQSLEENYKEALKLFGLVITSPHLKEEDFQREKRKVLTRILQINDDPDEIAETAFEYLIFGKDNPYAYPTIGYKEHVDNITIEDIKSFFNDFFLPNNSALVIVGSPGLEEIKAELENIFKDWKPKSFNPAEFSKNGFENKGIFFVHKEGSVQSEIRIGHTSSLRSEGDYYAKVVLNTILGGQFSSRINLNLREDKGYTYGAFSRFNHYKRSSYFHVSTSVGAENTGNAVKEILDELEKIKTGVSFEELTFAQSSIVRKFPSNFETYRQIGSNLTGKIIHDLEDDYFETYIDKIKNVSEAEVKTAAAENIHPERSAVLIVADREKVLNQLEGLKLDKVVEVNNHGEKIS